MVDRPGAGRLPADGPPATGERFVEIARVGEVVVEHITSSATPDSAEQRQDHDEWVLVVYGAAVVEIDGVPTSLTAGDWVWLPAGVPHRVVRTERGTQWLALHAPPGSPPA